jgi:serine/threonine protein phosphatase PrpC
MHIALRVAAANRHSEDRAAAIACGKGHLLLIADGAGGRSGGAAAAEAVLQSAQRLTTELQPCNWTAWLEELDQQLQDTGETTAVVAFCAQGEIFGASVGDSGAWLIHAAGYVDLTEHQRRKPLLGSGSALAVAFGPVRSNGRLLLASDGLFKQIAIAHKLLTEVAEAAEVVCEHVRRIQRNLPAIHDAVVGIVPTPRCIRRVGAAGRQA